MFIEKEDVQTWVDWLNAIGIFGLLIAVAAFSVSIWISLRLEA